MAANWLLAVGSWAIGGAWDDDDIWRDGPPARPMPRGDRLLRVPRPVRLREAEILGETVIAAPLPPT